MYSAQAIEYPGVPLTSQKIVPGSTATGLSTNVLAYFQHTVAFTAGGTVVLGAGDTVVGLVSGATADIVSITVESGTFGGGDAAGTMVLKNYVGTFNSGEAVSTRGGINDATATNLTLVPVADTSDYPYKGANAKALLVQATAQDARVAVDGSNPDQSVNKGILVPLKTSVMVTDAQAIRNFRCIDAVNAQATTVNVVGYF